MRDGLLVPGSLVEHGVSAVAEAQLLGQHVGAGDQMRQLVDLLVLGRGPSMDMRLIFFDLASAVRQEEGSS